MYGWQVGGTHPTGMLSCWEMWENRMLAPPGGLEPRGNSGSATVPVIHKARNVDILCCLNLKIS